MKKRSFVFVLVLLIVVFLTSIFLVSCKKPSEEPTSWFQELNVVEKPEEFLDYELDIEWVTELKADRPIAILFNGYKEYDKKEKLALAKAAYVQTGKTVLSTNATTKLNIASLKEEDESIDLTKFWDEAEFSVGIFHYERFADMVDSEGNVLDFSYKIFDRTKSEYKVEDGIKTASFNLLEAFVTAYKKHVIDPKISTKAVTESAKGFIRPFEVRFIGHKGGANFAVAASDYLYALNDTLPAEQKIDRYLPNRVALLNPYWSNALALDVNVDYVRENNADNVPKKLTSLLTYNKVVIPALERRGVVFEVYQSNKEHFLSYKEIYHGVEKVTVEEEIEYQWKEGTDTNAYDLIKNTVAYMTFNESVTASYFQTEDSGFYHKYDRLILDWYLYSIQGSDSTNSSHKLSNGQWPTIDIIEQETLNIETYLKYGMSAWTPTVFLKVMQGHLYEMKQYKRKSGDTPATFVEFVMKEFSSNIHQASDFDIRDGGFFIAGYVYETFDNTSFVNLASNARVANVTVRLTVSTSDQSGTPDYFEAKTDETGFYKIELKEEYLQTDTNKNSYDLRLTIFLDSSNHSYTQYVNQADLQSVKIYDLMNIASINRPTNDSDNDKYRLGVDQSHKSCIIIKNCGLVKK